MGGVKLCDMAFHPQRPEALRAEFLPISVEARCGLPPNLEDRPMP